MLLGMFPRLASARLGSSNWVGPHHPKGGGYCGGYWRGVSSFKTRTFSSVRGNHRNAGTRDGASTTVESDMLALAIANITPMTRQLGYRSATATSCCSSVSPHTSTL